MKSLEDMPTRPYVIAASSSSDWVERAVEKLLTLGYKPHGSISTASDAHGIVTYTQPMLKES